MNSCLIIGKLTVLFAVVAICSSGCQSSSLTARADNIAPQDRQRPSQVAGPRNANVNLHSSPDQHKQSVLAPQIQRAYTEADLDDVFSGSFGVIRSSLPQYEEVAREIGGCGQSIIGSVLQSNFEGQLSGFRTVNKEGFAFGGATVENNEIKVEFWIYCGVTKLSEGQYKRLKFADVDEYLRKSIFESTDTVSVYKQGSFNGKSIGEAAWHRTDEKTGQRELVSLRGLTITRILLTPKGSTTVGDTVSEKMDACAQSLDQWIKGHMFIRK